MSFSSLPSIVSFLESNSYYKFCLIVVVVSIMAPLQIPKNFKFKYLCIVRFQDGAGPFSSPSPSNNNPPIIMSDTFVEDLCKRKKNFMKALENFRMHGLLAYLGLSMLLMIGGSSSGQMYDTHIC